MFSFLGWIFRRFPDYFKKTDSYKTPDTDKGLLERYCANFEEELDENFYPFIDKVLDFYNGLKIDPKYLPYAAYNAGNIGLTGDNDIDARLVAFAVSLYKVKGAEPGFKMIFNLLGFPDIIIIENYPDPEFTYDDESSAYDDVSPMGEDIIYDTRCAPCVDYDIIYEIPGGEVHTFTEAEWDLIAGMVCSIQAIDAKLRAMIPALAVADVIDTSGWVENVLIAATTCDTPTGLAIAIDEDFDKQDFDPADFF